MKARFAFKRSADAEEAMRAYARLQPRLFWQTGFKSKPWVVATKAPPESIELEFPIVWIERCAKAKESEARA